MRFILGDQVNGQHSWFKQKDKNTLHLIAARYKCHNIRELHYQRPNEHRLRQELHSLTLPKDFTIRECDTEHFLLPYEEITDYITAGQHNHMESFYRKMRKRFLILMDDKEPVGGTGRIR